MTIHIWTGNQGKIREFERILGQRLTSSNIELDEIQALDTKEVCRRKAEAAYKALGCPVLVDDTGFELAALGGFPGALVTWAIGSGTTAILHRMLPNLSDDSASVVTAIGYASEAGIYVFSGRLDGTVIASPRGTNGFGFDEVFIPKGKTKTFAEMDDDAKDLLSPSGEALRSMSAFLEVEEQRRHMIK